MSRREIIDKVVKEQEIKTIPVSNITKKSVNATNTKESGKEYTEITERTVSMTYDIYPNRDALPRETVRVNGLGQYLNGLYYVEKATFSFNNSGFTQKIDVIRDSVGDTIKTSNNQRREVIT